MNQASPALYFRPVTRQRSDKVTFLCSDCGDTFPRWEGRCPACGAWNTLAQFTAPSRSQAKGVGRIMPAEPPPQELDSVSLASTARRLLGIGEVNRVLGDGLVPGSVVLLAGDPGIGKSTLLLQIASAFAKESPSVVYVSGEESALQVRLRADRLGTPGSGIHFLPETDAAAVLGHLDRLGATLVVVDSIQTMTAPDLPGAAGSVAQVRECARIFIEWAKASQTPVLLTGHVTKDGNIAGPRVLEHMVDVVLYLEGDPLTALRLLRGVKNRFGSTNEVGLFEMQETGLVEVLEPSRLLLSGRMENSVGSTVVPVLEGARPMLVEVQGLTNPTVFPAPRRTGNGVDFQRLLLVVAVLSRRIGISLAAQDVLVNVAGGLRITEPAADIGMALAIVSSLRDQPVHPSLVALGEIGLGGELRPVPQLRRRLIEAARLGFDRALAPASSASEAAGITGMAVTPVSDLRQALRAGLAPRKGSAAGGDLEELEAAWRGEG